MTTTTILPTRNRNWGRVWHSDCPAYARQALIISASRLPYGPLRSERLARAEALRRTVRGSAGARQPAPKKVTDPPRKAPARKRNTAAGAASQPAAKATKAAKKAPARKRTR